MARKKRKTGAAKKRTSDEALPRTTIEHTTSMGNELKVTFELVAEGEVRVVEYLRRRRGASNYSRVKDEEGKVHPADLIPVPLEFPSLTSDAPTV